MVMRIGGLASGMDIDSLVEKLMQAERMPLNKAFQQKQTLQWQRDSYRSVNAKLKTFDTFLFDKMILSGKMNQKTATSSNESLVSVKANPGATGNITIGGVSQLASAAQAVGSQTKFNGSSKLNELELSDPNLKSISIKSIGADGRLASEATKIEFNGDMTINDLVKKINSSGAGVTALFEGGKLSLSAKNTGSEKSGQGEIVVTEGLEVFNKLGFSTADNKLASNGKNAMFEVNGILTERSSNTFTISGYEMTLKQTFNAGTVAAGQKTATETEYNNAVAAQPQLNQNYINAIKQFFNVDITDLGNFDEKNYTSQFKLNAETAYKTAFAKPTLTDDQQALFNGFSNKKALAKLTNDDITTIQTKTLEELKEDDRFKSFNEADLKSLKENVTDISAIRERAIVDTSEQAYKTVSKSLIADDTIVNFFKDNKGKSLSELKQAINSETDEDLKKKLKGISDSNLTSLKDLAEMESINGGTPQAANRLEELSTIAKNQVEYEAELKQFNAAKQAYQAGNQRVADAKQAWDNAQKVNVPTGDTTVAPVTMQASTNTSAAKEQIKEFVEKYNEMIDEFNKLLKETKYRDYAPLTDEQRKEMSESEQKLWDEKAKSGLLRSDSILRDGMSKMRSTFLGSVGGLGDKLMDSLAEIGITTSNDVKEGGKLVINESKLDAALAKDPDQVYKLFSQNGKVTETTDENGRKITEDSRGIAYRLRDAMKDMTAKIEKKAGKEGATEQTYSLGKQIVNSDERITKLQAKLKDIEARYWKQFTAMEQAINKANSQSSMFMQG
ncbi:flagellar filament capping protein FliD [Lysinibacillus sp. FSL P4-0201]|uniref:flagellar filament capping protein FliD n=1 Tax=Lysinibacillus sp. FSL P4-0201 TaxID=2921721 RepID=UPI00315ADDA5